MNAVWYVTARQVTMLLEKDGRVVLRTSIHVEVIFLFSPFQGIQTFCGMSKALEKYGKFATG